VGSQTLDNIDRLVSPVTRAQVAPYIERGHPFICAGLLDGSRLERVGERAQMIELFGDGVADYFGRTEVALGSVMIKVPPALETELVTLAKQSPIGRDEMLALVWMGQEGCVQFFHCDMDARHNFLVQAYGRKRICLVSPDETQKMLPRLDESLLLSDHRFGSLTERDKLALLRFVDARDCILEPGEMLYIPPLWWHFVEYLADSLSVSWRSEHGAFFRELSSLWGVLWTHEWPLWQGIVSRLSSDAALTAHAEASVRAVVASLRARAVDAQPQLIELHRALCPDRYRAPYQPADLPFFESRLERPPAKTLTWSPDDVPRLRPYARFAMAGESIVIFDGPRAVTELEGDPDLLNETMRLLAEVRRGDRTVASLMEDFGGMDLIEQLGVAGWLSRSP
jgi:hypothetical protein